MNSKVFADRVYKTFTSDNLSLFETIKALMDELDLDLDDIVEYLKEEKTLLNDLQAECEQAGMLKGNHKVNDIEELF